MMRGEELFESLAEVVLHHLATINNHLYLREISRALLLYFNSMPNIHCKIFIF